MYYLDEDEERAVERRDVTEAATAFAAKVAAREAARRAAGERAVPTGYLLFCADLRPHVEAALEDLLEYGEELSPLDTIKELAAQWMALSDEERAEWNAKAKEINLVIAETDARAAIAARVATQRVAADARRAERQAKQAANEAKPKQAQRRRSPSARRVATCSSALTFVQRSRQHYWNMMARSRAR
jgi:hypothetical protein